MTLKIVFHEQGFDELRKSPAVAAAVAQAAARIAAAAGEGFEAEPAYLGKKRARSSVVTATYAARLRNAREDTLLRALDAGRG